MTKTERRHAAILEAIRNGATRADAGRAVGVTPARASQVARAAGLPKERAGLRPGTSNGGLGVRSARGTTLLLRLTLAAADRGLTPEQFLEAAESSVPRVDSGCVRRVDG